MKFQSITMNNFMRYEGENTITFSCDPERNVTVVLGDNTVGKTTIAQAFRWGLYGALLAGKGKENGDFVLLNNDVANRLTEQTRATVSVKIIFYTDQNRYILTRAITYRHSPKNYGLEEVSKDVSLMFSDIHSASEDIMVEKNQIQEVINEMLPSRLSSYFLFDGENWNDIAISGVRENIKESVHILTGLSSIKNAMYHLKDMGSQSVVSRFKSNIKGTGGLYDNLQSDIRRDNHQIAELNEKLKLNEIGVTNAHAALDKLDKFLQENASTESMQREFKQRGVTVNARQDQMMTGYKMLVTEFSEKGYLIMAKPLIDASLRILKNAHVQRRDVPHMHQATIDYLINRGECICGNKILPDSKELYCLQEQRNFLPPADIGSILGEFERTAVRWTGKTDDHATDITEAAVTVEKAVENYRIARAEYEKLAGKLDKHINFEETRRDMRTQNEILQKLSVERGGIQNQISHLKAHIESLQREMETMEAKTQENKKWHKRVQIAQEVYDELNAMYTNRENRTFVELNRLIQENFEKMFNEKDKRIELDKNYNIKMFYRNDGAFKEEKNLSEGEKVARNFAFIVTMMQYSKEKQKDDMLKNDTLPIVLDGPFSKLSDENIGLVAKALPQAAEQVIIFMLQKDWQYTGLDRFVGAQYVIDKASDANYASVHKVD